MRSLRRGRFGGEATNQAIGANQVEFAVSTETADVINVTGQLKDGNGNNMAEQQVLDVLLSDSDAGAGLVATAPDGGVAIGTDGIILDAAVAGKLVKVQTEADGSFDLDITETGTKTLYVAAVLKNDVSVSDAVVFP